MMLMEKLSLWYRIRRTVLLPGGQGVLADMTRMNCFIACTVTKKEKYDTSVGVRLLAMSCRFDAQHEQSSTSPT